MKKKGFTLIEIIIAIALISVIGVGSVVGVKTISKNITINKLEQITDKILLAAEVYIEANKETYNQLYNNKNGVMIPLNVLVNEGLLDITGTKLNDSELENNYVISMLSGDGTSKECINIKTITSWNETSNEPIYICGNSTGGSGSTNNDIKQTLILDSSSYIAKGENPNNWIEFPVTSNPENGVYFPNDSEKDLWRILSIDSSNTIQLIYNKPVLGNSDNIYNYSSCTTYDGDNYCFLREKYHSAMALSTKNFDGYVGGFNGYDLIYDSGGKKQDLFTSIINSSYIKPNTYDYKYLCGTTKPGEVPITSTTLWNLGVISFPTYEETFMLGKTWIFDSIVGFSFCDKDKNIIISSGTLYQNDIYNKIKTGKYYIDTYDYQPVVTLKDNVKIVKRDCADGVKLGSKECPYKLECSEC